MSNIYLNLVRDRKKCRLCEPIGLTNPAVCGDGLYDSDHIGPWSRWYGNPNAELMVVGQDWGDTEYFIKRRGMEDPKNPTNKVLVELLTLVGIDMDGVFLTNAILCLKRGGLQAIVKEEWFRNCEVFLKSTIQLVEPRILVTLGKRAYVSVSNIFGLSAIPFNEAVSDPDGFALPNGSTRFFPMYHCGRRILNTHRPLHKQKEDWLRIKCAL